MVTERQQKQYAGTKKKTQKTDYEEDRDTENVHDVCERQQKTYYEETAKKCT